MNNNDVLRGLRYALMLDDSDLPRLMKLGGIPLNQMECQARLLREGDPGAIFCDNDVLEAFLDGLIVDRRGPPDPNRPPPPKMPLTNNEVLKKLRIALKLRDVDMVKILDVGGHPMTKGEVSALFRKPGNRQYRSAGNQMLRGFLRGLGRLRRDPEVGRAAPPRPD